MIALKESSFLIYKLICSSFQRNLLNFVSTDLQATLQFRPDSPNLMEDSI